MSPRGPALCRTSAIAIAITLAITLGLPDRPAARAQPVARARRSADGALITAGDPDALVRAELFCSPSGPDCANVVASLLALARRQPTRLRATVAILGEPSDEWVRAAVEAARVGRLEDWLGLLSREPRRRVLPSLLVEAGLDPIRAASPSNGRRATAAAQRRDDLGLALQPPFVLWNGEVDHGSARSNAVDLERRLTRAEHVARTRLAAGVPRARLHRTLEDEARRDRAPRSPPIVEPRARRRLPPGETTTFGDAAAPVTIVLFGALDCPQCPGLWADARRLAEQRPGLVRVTWRHLPSLSPDGRAIATVAACAARRGELVALLERITGRRHPQAADRTAYAALAGGGPAFDAGCAEDVARDVAAAADLGLVTPPALFVNGLETPARSWEVKRAVDAELQPGDLAELAREGEETLSAPAP